MKSIQKITRVHLKIDQNDDFILLAIVSSEPDYKLSLSINKKFRISLKSSIPVKISDDKGEDLLFSRFTDASMAPDLVYSLVSNRSGKDFLLKKLKNVDYIFQIQKPENEYDIEETISMLRETESVSGVFNVDISSFKDKNLQFLIL